MGVGKLTTQLSGIGVATSYGSKKRIMPRRPLQRVVRHAFSVTAHTRGDLPTLLLGGDMPAGPYNTSGIQAKGAGMTPDQARHNSDRARRIYDERLRAVLESDHHGRFVAVDPDSGDYFLADTFDAVVAAARDAHPTRPPHVLRVGHPAALHIGGAWS